MKCLTFRTFISQLDEARRPGDDKQDDVTEQPDVADEDNAIEMTDDIDAKLHDLPPDDGNDDSDDDGEDDGGDDLDKQMGDLGDEQTNKQGTHTHASTENESPYSHRRRSRRRGP